MTRQGSPPWRLPLPLPLPFGRSNLQNFLHTATPVVSSTVVPLSCIGDINNCWLTENGKDSTEYFILEDLWKSFDDLSAVGVGTPVVLNHSTTVMQYYVPYLSAVQIYTAKFSTGSSSDQEASDQTQMDCWSISDGSESDYRSRISVDNSVKSSSKDYSITSGGSITGGSSGFERDDTRHPGHLYFQYHEVASPIWRTPIFDKIMDFVHNYPRILTLRSIDLSPASWMSIAWYPIYSIPTSYVKDLGTCFLTYHTLSSSFQDSQWNSDVDQNDPREFAREPEGYDKGKLQSEVTLPAFGLAAHKMTGEVWMNHDKYDQERLFDLYRAADSWLKQLNFHHHDFEFFKMHY